MIIEIHPVVCTVCGLPATKVVSIFEDHRPIPPKQLITYTLEEVTLFCDDHFDPEAFPHDHNAICTALPHSRQGTVVSGV